MRNFYLIVNKDKPNAEKGADILSEYLKYRGCTCLRSYKRKNCYAGKGYTDPSKIPANIDCVIVLGGDGTLIQAARDLADRDFPLLGVNMGYLGYLSQVNSEMNLLPTIDRLILDDYEVQSRMMLHGRVSSGNEVLGEDIALNDIVLTRTGVTALKFELYVDGEFISEYHADGIIIATPTGSTAYNLSAGGPIALPDSQLILMTPICAHTLNSRSIVLPASSKIMLKIKEDSRAEQAASFDGDTNIVLHPGDVIEIEKSAVETKLIQMQKTSFLDTIRQKLK